MRLWYNGFTDYRTMCGSQLDRSGVCPGYGRGPSVSGQYEQRNREMDTEYYRNFMAMVEAGNMTRAAEFLHITQPTLSKQLQLLEKMYGTKLIVAARGRRSMHLTEAGEMLYRRSKHICALEDLALDEVASVTQEVRGVLRFSISQGRSHNFIREVLAGFYARYPQVVFEMHEGIITTQQEELLTGVTDLGVCNTELTQPEQFEVLFTRSEELTVVACPGFLQVHPGREMTLELLRDVPLAISGGCAGMLQKHVGNLYEYFHPVAICTTKGSALAWAQTGKAAALIPTESQEVLLPGLQRLRVECGDIRLSKSIVRARNRPLSYVAEVFLRYYAAVRSGENVAAEGNKAKGKERTRKYK